MSTLPLVSTARSVRPVAHLSVDWSHDPHGTPVVISACRRTFDHPNAVEWEGDADEIRCRDCSRRATSRERGAA